MKKNMLIRNGRKITRRKKTKETTRVTTKAEEVVVAAIKEEVVVEDVATEAAVKDKVEETMKGADSTKESIFGDYVQPTSTAQPEELQVPEEAEVVEAMVEVVVAVAMNRIIRMVTQRHLLHTMEVQ